MTDCIFCKIINGDFNTEFVYENEYAVVFKDIELLGKLMMTVKATTKKLGIKSYRTVINTGKDAGQEVFHLHIHILSGNMRF